MEKERLLKIVDLCQYLGIGRNTAYALIKSGKIRAFKAGRGWIVPESSVVEYIVSETIALQK